MRNHNGRRRATFALALAVTSAAAMALTSLSTTQAVAAPSPEPEGVTMVNGAGKSITLPASAADMLSAAVGRSGNTGKDAGAKAEPGADPNTVIGPDGRVQESSPATSPWAAITHLDTNILDCTGFMLSRDVLVTAGHCVHWNGSWVTSYTATPGRTGNTKPFGSCSGGINDVWTTTNWINGYPADHDYGLVKLTCDVGLATGTFGWWYDTGENLVNQFMFVEGYPSDKPFATMWWDGDTVSSQTANKVWYWNDTATGQSGAPVYRLDSSSPGLCSGWCVTAIHTNGVGGGNPANSGVRFRPDVMSFINFWIGQP